jgi:hypothetical protein
LIAPLIFPPLPLLPVPSCPRPSYWVNSLTSLGSRKIRLCSPTPCLASPLRPQAAFVLFRDHQIGTRFHSTLGQACNIQIVRRDAAPKAIFSQLERANSQLFLGKSLILFSGNYFFKDEKYFSPRQEYRNYTFPYQNRRIVFSQQSYFFSEITLRFL